MQRLAAISKFPDRVQRPEIISALEQYPRQKFSFFPLFRDNNF